MQKFRPAFIKIQPESLAFPSQYNTESRESAVRPKYYETEKSEDYIANTCNLVDSIIVENNYYSNQIREKNTTMKLPPRTRPKASKEDIIKRNIYMVSRMAKTQKALDDQSKLNRAKKKANAPKEDKFAPLLNKKSLVIASKNQKETRAQTANKPSVTDCNRSKLNRSLVSRSDIDNTRNNALFYYDKSKKTVSCKSLSNPRSTARLRKTEDPDYEAKNSRNGFTPKINKRSKALVGRTGYNQTSRERELTRLHKQKLQYRHELSNMLKEQKDEDEVRECSFAPKINRHRSITFDSKVEDRLLHWNTARKLRVEALNSELLEKEAREHSRPKKPKVKEDLSFVSKESVQKSFSRFLYWKDYSKKKQKDKEELKAKFCLLRSNF